MQKVNILSGVITSVVIEWIPVVDIISKYLLRDSKFNSSQTVRDQAESPLVFEKNIP